jgi:putative spermidine/putrescine transport system ATP-binding protein
MGCGLKSNFEGASLWLGGFFIVAFLRQQGHDVTAGVDIKLDIRGVGKRYGRTIALEPTSLDVRRGEFLTLLGPSGSGKTTLLMMIAGLTEPSSGTIRLGGADITARPAYQRDIGVVFQSYALFPHMTVAENLAFPLLMRKQSSAAIDDAVRDALALVRLTRLAARYPRELSGGQQQRVAVARAIVFKPAIVLMDEPLGALDKRLREELKFEIRKLHRDLGVTIVYVTHDQDEAMVLSDRICLMNNARVEQIGTPADVYRRPVSRFAADFVGESNLLPARGNGSEVITVAGCALRTAAAVADGDHLVLIRPERLRLSRGGAPNSISGTTTSILDLGGLGRATVALASGAELKVSFLGGDADGFAIGEPLTFTVQPQDIVVLPMEAR